VAPATTEHRRRAADDQRVRAVPAARPFPDPVTTDVARSLFFDPGTHTIALDVPATVPAVGGIGTINSTAHYAVTFKRVNEDGSPYTG
jgi:hypothetical protein